MDHPEVLAPVAAVVVVAEVQVLPQQVVAQVESVVVAEL
jgi:hypothetical protein